MMKYYATKHKHKNKTPVEKIGASRAICFFLFTFFNGWSEGIQFWITFDSWLHFHVTGSPPSLFKSSEIFHDYFIIAYIYPNNPILKIVSKATVVNLALSVDPLCYLRDAMSYLWSPDSFQPTSQ